MKRALAGAAVVLALGAAAAGVRPPAPARVDAVELAREIRARRPGLQVADLRSSAAFAAESVTTAVNGPPPGAGGPLVVYAADEADAARAARVLSTRFADVRVLSGGLDAWRAEVLQPVLPADPAARTAEDQALVELSAYFGGAPRTGGAAQPVAARRRGC